MKALRHHCMSRTFPLHMTTSLYLGAVLGRNIEQITIGLRELITSYTNDPFFSRIINPKLTVQKAMLLFRYCGVPRMSYLLRVTPPAAIKRLAVEFDLTVLSKVKTLLDGLNQTSGRYKIPVDVSEFADGLYLCLLNVNGQSFTQKLVVSKSK